MAFWLATKREGQESDWIQRFDPRFWTVNFPRPMTATIIATAPDAVRVDAVFLRKGDLAGIIWESEDRIDHPLLAYATQRDYSRTTLSFRWQSAGVIPLDEINGPTLTIEGRDAIGAPRVWYVRLWNYADGEPTDARITLRFSELLGGYLLPQEADPVAPHDIDRMFISLVAPDYVPGEVEPLDAPVEGTVLITEIACTGERSMLEIGDVVVPPHGLAIATGFDDNGTQTPARVLRSIRQLGYRGSVVHYVGMSHYFRLAYDGEEFRVGPASDPLNTPTRVWHEDYFRQCAQAGLSPVASLSYEVLADHCPPDWRQLASGDQPALTGWDPPSTLLSPANGTAMAWLRSVAQAFVGVLRDAGAPVRFQIGEPWWWIRPDGHICIYDAAAQDALGGSPPDIGSLRGPLEPDALALLDAAGELLAASTASLTAAVRGAALPGTAEVLLLVFTPTIADPAMPEAYRANMPLGWASPAFDRLQVEDYDWLTAGHDAARRAGYALVDARLGYPPIAQDYFAGFVFRPQDRELWRRIDAGIDEARARSPHEIVVWALPQVARDGFIRHPDSQESEQDMQAFDDVLYPLALGRDATVVPEFSTTVTVTASGHERRNSLWSNARLRFDVGPGIRSEAELGLLIEFFRARRGAARGFRLRDPSDHSSNGMVGTPTAIDQVLGTANGTTADFPLVKRYGEGDAVQTRRITRPRAGTVLVSVNGAIQIGNWTLAADGIVTFATPPAAGAQVRAGFTFDVPVRFAEDRLEIAGAAFAAGEAPSVPIVEIREAS